MYYEIKENIQSTKEVYRKLLQNRNYETVAEYEQINREVKKKINANILILIKKVQEISELGKS